MPRFSDGEHLLALAGNQVTGQRTWFYTPPQRGASFQSPTLKRASGFLVFNRLILFGRMEGKTDLIPIEQLH